MATLVNKKKIASPFSNEAELVRVTYDFSVDGGAVADYDVLESVGACLVELVNIDVETAVTSGGALVMDLGKGAGGTEFKSDEAVADLYGFPKEASVIPMKWVQQWDLPEDIYKKYKDELMKSPIFSGVLASGRVYKDYESMTEDDIVLLLSATDKLVNELFEVNKSNN